MFRPWRGIGRLGFGLGLLLFGLRLGLGFSLGLLFDRLGLQRGGPRLDRRWRRDVPLTII
ncbi:hypothetical protein ENSA7_42100 [Enhygromyxa salina]|uniref:Uncharacterized protein n=1 Tax=Enhygromyxa salina TaxID=215803 RepID=A0A2S9YLV8_9BACT|nr:hypothetical protein ENSA7_42100 [Enhygromyxa salina]